MPNTDPEWHTGEFEPIKPVAPSSRGKPRPTPAGRRTTDTTNDDVATDRDQRHETE